MLDPLMHRHQRGEDAPFSLEVLLTDQQAVQEIVCLPEGVSFETSHLHQSCLRPLPRGYKQFVGAQSLLASPFVLLLVGLPPLQRGLRSTASSLEERNVTIEA